MLFSRELKHLLGEIPLIAEVDSAIRNHYFKSDQWLKHLKSALPGWIKSGQLFPVETAKTRHMFVFVCTQSWLPNAMLLCTAQRSMGHKVSFGYVPYRKWFASYEKLDLRRVDAYIYRILRKAEPFIDIVRFMAIKEDKSSLPPELEEQVMRITEMDCQYTKQIETVDRDDPLYDLRMERNMFVAKRAFKWMQENKPDLVVVPNGMILEYGAVFEVAKYLGIETVTYEFGEQNDRIWLAQEKPVMLQDTDEMWQQLKDTDFPEENYTKLDALYSSRTDGKLWQSFSRQWQGTPSEGQLSVREKLGLDDRPVVLLAANVIGDSLTLERQVFSETMTEWLQKTTSYFVERDEVQFILRIHPGEKYTSGPSVGDIVDGLFPELPEYVHLIRANDSINTYDLISIANLGLTYTTTVGMEMAMHGLPVVVSGNTHYRDRGFTLDPTTWKEYYTILDSFCAAPESYVYTEENVRLAKRYAYHFFFDYPFPYPWHLLNPIGDQPEISMERVLSPEGRQLYGRAFKYLAGEPISWEELAGG
jgi:hypothetical protein